MIIAINLGQYEEAMKLYTEAINIDSDQKKMIHRQGILEPKIKNANNCIKLERQLNPNLGLDQIIEIYKELTKLNPNLETYIVKLEEFELKKKEQEQEELVNDAYNEWYWNWEFRYLTIDDIPELQKFVDSYNAGVYYGVDGELYEASDVVKFSMQNLLTFEGVIEKYKSPYVVEFDSEDFYGELVYLEDPKNAIYEYNEDGYIVKVDSPELEITYTYVNKFVAKETVRVKGLYSRTFVSYSVELDFKGNLKKLVLDGDFDNSLVTYAKYEYIYY